MNVELVWWFSRLCNFVLSREQTCRATRSIFPYGDVRSLLQNWIVEHWEWIARDARLWQHLEIRSFGTQARYRESHYHTSASTRQLLDSSTVADRTYRPTICLAKKNKSSSAAQTKFVGIEATRKNDFNCLVRMKWPTTVTLSVTATFYENINSKWNYITELNVTQSSIRR